MAKGEFQTKEEDKEDVGPLGKSRSCTDIICIFLFLLFMVGNGVLAYFAFTLGDPWRIINGYDSFGNTCGVKNVKPDGVTSELAGLDLTDSPYLMYYDFTVMLPSSVGLLMNAGESTGAVETTMMRCVKKCPDGDIDLASVALSTTGGNTLAQRLQSYYDMKKAGLDVCQYNFWDNNPDIAAYFNGNANAVTPTYKDWSFITSKGASGPCPAYVLPSTAVLSRCIPLLDALSDVGTDLAKAEASKLSDSLKEVLSTNVTASQVMQYAMSDIMHSYRELVVMCGASLVISFIIILLLGWIAQIMIYAIALLTAVACIAGPAYFWYVWYQANEELKADTLQLQSQIDNVETLMIYAIILTVVCIVVLLLIIFLRSRVGLMVTLFKEAGFMVMRMISILFTPILLALFLLAWACLWTFVSGYIYTAGTAKEFEFTRTYADGSSPPADMETFKMVYFEDHTYIIYVWLYHLFCLYWGTEFLLACHEMANAGAFAQFYWTRDKRNVSFPVIRSIYWVFRYHIGTVAFGSCIIAIIQLLRTILAYIQNKTKDSSSEIVKYLLMCLQCCLWCFEKFMKFINRNAYIYTACKGTNFCTSAQKAFALLISNVVRMGVINCVGAFILFLGKFLVVVIVGCLGYFMMRQDEELYYWAVPVLLASIFAFAVAHTFFSVYEIGIDTIFICFAEDETINDGTAGREYYMSKNLMQWVENSSEAIKNLKRKKGQQRAAAKSGNMDMEDM